MRCEGKHEFTVFARFSRPSSKTAIRIAAYFDVRCECCCARPSFARGRAASALLAMTVAAAVATAMLNLYVEVQVKTAQGIPHYGANIVIVAKDARCSLPTL